jgi:hypothetical protein
MSTLWVLHDSNPARRVDGCFPVGSRDPHELNRDGYGVFVAVNVFRGARRTSNLVRIRAWAAEIDGGKRRAERTISRSPIRPSIVVESKRGFHLWFLARDATAENYRAIVGDRLVPFFGADPAVKDIARVLRAPGFYHLKDPSDPFLVRVVDRSGAVYSEREMLEAFPDIGGAQRRLRDRQRRARAARAQQVLGGDFWDRAHALDCEMALTRLSGHPAVAGEQYEFHRLGSGKLRIVVNGDPSGCWIDSDGKIGSCDRGGPGVAQWIRWFGHSYREVRRVLVEAFPELEERPT